MSSGSDVVGAATSAPVTSFVIAFSAISDVSTASRYSPWYVQRPDHSVQNASVRASAESASSTGGAGSNDGCQESTNRSLAPSDTENSAVTVPSSTVSSRGVLSRNASGPAAAVRPSGSRSIHGTTSP